MLGWNEIIREYVIRHADRTKRAAEPLLSRFGIEYFTYHRIDQKGGYTVLVNHPGWAEHYVSERLYEEDPYLRTPKAFRSGLYHWNEEGSEVYRNSILKKSNFDWDLGVVLIEKREDSVEFYGFAANKARSNLNHLSLNHAEVLRQFGHYFKSKFAPVLQEMEERVISLPSLKGADYFRSSPTKPLNAGPFLEELGLKNSELTTLSTAEKRCINPLLNGLSNKEIGQQLNLSPRTIETHLESLKRKLNSTYKRDLFQKLNKLKDLGTLTF